MEHEHVTGALCVSLESAFYVENTEKFVFRFDFRLPPVMPQAPIEQWRVFENVLLPQKSGLGINSEAALRKI